MFSCPLEYLKSKLGELGYVEEECRGCSRLYSYKSFYSNVEECKMCGSKVKPLEDGEWTRGVTLSPESIPQCKMCIEDTRKFSELPSEEKFKYTNMTPLDIYVGRRNKTLKWIPSCTKSCLWYDWFQFRRDHMK